MIDPALKAVYYIVMKNKQNLKIILTALVLLVGGYFIQKSVSTTDILVGVVEGVRADTPHK